jgi:hypothetical protein
MRTWFWGERKHKRANEIRSGRLMNVRSAFKRLTMAAVVFAVALCASAQTPAPTSNAPFPRDADRTINLTSFTGQSYLQAMQASGIGIYDRTNGDDQTAVTIADSGQIVSRLGQCDPSVGISLYALFTNGESSFQGIASQIQGQKIAPAQIRGVLTPLIGDLKAGAAANIALAKVSDLALLTSGSGTLVIVDAHNCFYNVAYQAPIVQSGRSYAMSPTRLLLDCSDEAYLRELTQSVSTGTAADSSAFYHAMFKVLTNSDPSGIAALSDSEQTTLTDFLTIYTAELDRHVMAGLSPAPSGKPWEIDISEVTLLANFSAVSGVIVVKGASAQGSLASYGGGAIGDHRQDFMALAQEITSFESLPQNHPNMIEDVTKLTPIVDPSIASTVQGDALRRILVYLNRPEFQSDVQHHPADFENAICNLEMQIRADSAAISRYLASEK